MPDSIIQKPLAIVGMACRLPEADSLEAYWKLLVEGRSAVRPLSERVLDRSLHFDSRKGVRGKTYTDVGGLIPQRPLDRDLLGLTDEQLVAWDECHLIFAEVAARAWSAVRLTKSDTAASRVGVYIGHSGGSRTAGDLIYATMAEQTADLLRDTASFSKLSSTIQESIIAGFAQRMRQGRPVRGENGHPNLEASAAARLVAEVLNLDGPRMVLDAACASSLVALGLAALDLQSGAVEAAIVGGASYNKVDSLILFSQAQSCSATASRPFDENADGLISSEGYIALVIKTLERAIADGDTIHGVLRGLGVATDGRGKSLWAPRREGQTMAMKRAYATAADAKRVQFVEAHATSTQVGDATETQALADFFGQHHRVGTLPVGSVKSNIGHTLETAGLAGLLKTILAMQHGTIPPTIHLEQPSTSIDWSKVPFKVPTHCMAWSLPEDGTPRCGAVNAFGIGGLNVHVVVEEYRADYHQKLAEYAHGGAAQDTAHRRPEPIAIVGLGVIVPGAQSAEQLSSLVDSHESKIVDPPLDRWRKQMGIRAATATPSATEARSATPSTARGGYLLDYAYDWKKHRVPPKQVDRANPLQFMLLDAAGQALDPYLAKGLAKDHERTSVIVGTIFGGEFGHQLQLGLRISELRSDLEHALHDKVSDAAKPTLIDEFIDRMLQANPALLDETGSFTSSTLASRITKQFNLMGGAMAIDAGDCSGEAALATASEMLRSRVSDLVLCAAGQRAMDLPSYQTWAARGQLSNAPNAVRLPAEGAVVLLLKRLSDATQAGDRVHGILHDIQHISLRVGDGGIAERSAVPFSTEHLIEQIGDLKSAQSILTLAVLLASDRVAPGQPCVIRSSSTHATTYEVIASRGPSIVEPSMVAEAERSSSSSNPPFASRTHVEPVLNRLPTPFSFEDWTEPAIRRPLIAAVFPGQGSQSSTMLDKSLSCSAAARQTLELADVCLGELGSPPYSVLCQQAASSTSSAQSVWPIQSSMLIADLVYAAWMFEQGVRPDLVIGHSLGELAAMVVAGAWSLPDALRFVYARAQAVAEKAELSSGLLSINRGTDEVQQVLDSFSAPITLTHHNSPHQSVVGGKLEYLSAFQAFIAPRRWSTTFLSVPAAFHTPLMVHAQHALVDSAQLATLRPMRIAMLSTVSGRFISDPAELRRNLLIQLTTPVRYQECIEQAYRTGCSSFVEVGPGSVLTRLNQAILKNGPVRCLAMEATAHLPTALDITAAPNGEHQTSDVSSGPNSGLPAIRSGISKPQASLPQIVSFDATANRRQKRRDQAASQPVFAHPRLPPVPASSPSERIETPTSNSDELEAFVRDFIVEHTGYPAEMIELDWDLEADLGIDSIKQAQLFGELRELFDIDPNRLAASQIRTARQIVDVLKVSGGKREWIAATPPSVADAPSPDALPAARVALSDHRIQDAPASNRQAIADFMIDFVIEHTGYPREIVDVQADFEADLGLDSIKLAQLFGELRSNFDFPVASNDRSFFGKCRSLADILALFPAEAEVDRERKDEAPAMPCRSTSFDQASEQKSSQDFEHGIEWGRTHAAAIQAKLIEHVDRLEAIASHSASSQPLRSATGLVMPMSQWPGDREWWQGVSEGAGVDEGSLIAEIDAMLALIETTGRSGLLDESPVSVSLVIEENAPVAEPADDTSIDEQAITHRYQLKMVESPLAGTAGARPTWQGAAVVIGNNAVATALARALEADGVHCLQLDANLPIDRLLAKLDEAWRAQPVLHAFLAMPHDRSAVIELSSSAWRDRRSAGMMTAFLFCQAWLKRVVEIGKIQHASLIALTRLGGDFGFAASIDAPESGALAGLLKAIVIENWVNGHRGLAVKIIDSSPSDEPAQIVDAVQRELANSSYDMEISWANGIRRVVRADRSPIRKLKRLPLTRGGTWICTGGGRGITAYVAEQLGLRYDLTLHLIGTAPVPEIRDEWRKLASESPRTLKLAVMQQARNDRDPAAINPIKAWENVEKALEIDATLQRFKALGLRAYYHSCDCADAPRLQQVVERIRELSGPISGCLHGAGMGQDARFDRKRLDKVEQCLSAKIDGSIALMEATQNDPLEFFLGFGSISGRFGANGHTDYSMANDGLAKCIGWYRERRPEVRAVCFHWHAWGDVGMATKPETKLALEMIDMQFMPAREGVEHLIREIEGGAPQREVLITDDRYYRLFYPSETLVNDQVPGDARSEFGLLESEAAASQMDRCLLNPQSDGFLREHRLNDRPLLPMVIGLELLVEAASKQLHWAPIQFGGPSIRIDHFQSRRGLRFFQDEPQTVMLQSDVLRPGVCNVELVSDFHARNGLLVEAKRRYMQASISAGNAARLLDWDAVDVTKLQWQDAIYPPAGSTFFVGPAFRVLKQTCLRQAKIFGRIQAPSLIELAGMRRNAMGWRTPSALLDACLYATGVLAWNHVQPGINLPVGIETLMIHQMPIPGESCLVESRFVRRDDRSAWFDFSVWGGDGGLRIEALSYQTAWLESELPSDGPAL